MRKTFVTLAMVLVTAARVPADTWLCPLPKGTKKADLKVEITPLKYGKTWAYAFEQDDNPSSTFTVTLPLLAKYQWNDAPPDVTGGRNRPFVGTAAVILGSLDAGNSTALTYPQIAALKRGGWGIANHSYAHSGNSWEPSQALKPVDFARELFWSQTVYAHRIGAGRGASHFVLPNGYVDYTPYLSAYGLRSSSRVGGSSSRSLFRPKHNPLDLDRTYLDENVWKQSNDPLVNLPKVTAPGDFLIDFTHAVDGDTMSANYRRWCERLEHISRKWGPGGDNSVWVAPTDEVLGYSLGAHAAKVTVNAKWISVALPDTIPGTALTLKISGLAPDSVFETPPGGTLYRKGTVAWLTTPLIGEPGTPAPSPAVRCIYAGPLKNLSWERPVSLAGVRIRQFGPGSKDFVLKQDAVTPDGKTQSLLPEGETRLRTVWGGWNLYPLLPSQAAVPAKELRVTAGKDLIEMEVWAVTDLRAGALTSKGYLDHAD